MGDECGDEGCNGPGWLPRLLVVLAGGETDSGADLFGGHRVGNGGGEVAEVVRVGRRDGIANDKNNNNNNNDDQGQITIVLETRTSTTTTMATAQAAANGFQALLANATSSTSSTWGNGKDEKVS